MIKKKKKDHYKEGNKCVRRLQLTVVQLQSYNRPAFLPFNILPHYGKIKKSIIPAGKLRDCLCVLGNKHVETGQIWLFIGLYIKMLLINPTTH